MDIQAFLMENVPKMEAEEVWVSGRFSEPFRIRGISEEENARLRAGCRTRDGLDGVDAVSYTHLSYFFSLYRIWGESTSKIAEFPDRQHFSGMGKAPAVGVSK